LVPRWLRISVSHVIKKCYVCCQGSTQAIKLYQNYLQSLEISLQLSLGLEAMALLVFFLHPGFRRPLEQPHRVNRKATLK